MANFKSYFWFQKFMLSEHCEACKGKTVISTATLENGDSLATNMNNGYEGHKQLASM